MKNKVAIRVENKNIWEKRVPIVPNDMKDLIEKESIDFVVETSSIRAFNDEQYREIGVKVAPDIQEANVIFAIKEIPIPVIKAQDTPKTYIFFSHTIKGQKHNMPMLKSIMETKSTLIDYEKVVNEKGFRLIFFGNWAGLAGMIEILWGFGQRVKMNKKLENPFLRIKHTWEYENLDSARKAVSEIGEEIIEKGLPEDLVPLVIGFAGYGNVSTGAQSMLDLLPVEEINPRELIDFYNRKEFSSNCVYKVVFKEEHMVEPIEGEFELQHYYDHGKTKYRGIFEQHFPYLSILINAIYWSDKYPRLITKKFLKEQFESNKDIRCQIIGDISCDIEGGIEATLKTTKPDNPVFIYNPFTNEAIVGLEGKGMAIMAVDNLPCELPIESSISFSETLKPFVPIIAKTDYRKSFDNLELPPVIKNAVIVHQGKLTQNYQYLEEHLKDF
ncbi:MAG: bifunctional lysine ketoglutarate reductase /saccharopine dehydrogenase family protein [Candidatus Hodarchaeota archaeon]